MAGGWQEVTTHLTSPLTSLALTSVGGQSSNIRAVEIDNTVIVQGDAEDIDSLIDTPTNYTADSGNNGGNYSTINPLSTSGATLANGNLQVTASSGSGLIHFSTIGVSSGKWYAEWTATSAGSTQMVGISKGVATGSYLGANSDGFGYYGSNGQKYNGGGTSYGATYGSKEFLDSEFVQSRFDQESNISKHQRFIIINEIVIVSISREVESQDAVGICVDQFVWTNDLRPPAIVTCHICVAGEGVIDQNHGSSPQWTAKGLVRYFQIHLAARQGFIVRKVYIFSF